MVEQENHEDVTAALVNAEFLSKSPEIAASANWPYRTFSEDFGEDSKAFSEANRRNLRDRRYSPTDAELHFACFLHGRPQRQSTCGRCGSAFAYLTRWHYRDPLSLPAPERCEKCEGELRRRLIGTIPPEPDVPWAYMDGLLEHLDALEKIREAVGSFRISFEEAIRRREEIDARLVAIGVRNEKGRRKFFESNIPLIYREPIVLAKLPNRRAYQRVMDWRTRVRVPGARSRGLIAVGDTGVGKTRSICDLIRASFLTPDSVIDNFVVMPAVKFRELVIEGTQPGHEKWQSDRFEAVREQMRTTDFLVLDDLHQAKLSPRYSEELFALVEHRTANGLPIFVTTQVSGRAFLEKILAANEDLLEQASAIIRRLREFCDLANFDKDGVEG